MTHPDTPELDEKTPEGADSYSLTLNTKDYSTILDTLKDHALKLVANAQSEMSDEQWDEWVNEHTTSYAAALTRLLAKRELEGRIAEVTKISEELFGLKGSRSVAHTTLDYLLNRFPELREELAKYE